MKIKKILFVCAANVGRSQMAEGYYNAFTKTEHATSAALIQDRRNKYDYKPAPEIQEIMKRDGIDISSQTIQLLNRDLCDQADMIVLLLDTKDITSEFKVEDIDSLDFLELFYHHKLLFHPIADPYNADQELCLLVRNTIKQFILTLV